MRVQSLSPVVNVASFTDGGDPLALLQAIFAASAHEMRGAAVTMSEQALNNLSTLAELRQVQDKLESLAPAGDGKSVLLGSTLDSGKALKAQIEALGFSLNTEERYNLSSVTRDKNGTVVSTSNKHLATTAEMQAAEAGKLVSGPTGGVEVRSVTALDGSSTSYTLYKNERALTATQADVTVLMGQVAADMNTLQQSVSQEISRVQAFANAISDNSKEGERLFTDARKQERSKLDTDRADKRHDVGEAIQARVRQRRDIEQHHKLDERNRAG